MVRRWGLSIGLLVVAGLAFVFSSLVTGVVFVVLAALTSPRAFPRSISDAAARELSAQDGKPIVYWRPGCPFCLRLRARVGRFARRAHWVDIWADPDGAASVRAVTGGDETVPTVVHRGEGFVNPAPARVLEMLRA
ncbi:mycoredoxin [Actinoplanes tereljensis]|uniref:Membrane protein n=1 Tax=Paractinoplanes tereljensis TaxID=571912 RepID=A0A919NJB5_9ACTN|nr:glutaredoxin domain-containing protein [Actinoplanes tereljensis]GIF19243.1 membrane protein [Actinoplanes tereljensis]